MSETANVRAAGTGRSGRRASTDVAIVMIVAALVSAFAIGIYNYATGRQLIREKVTSQLVDVGANAADQIERGLGNLSDITATLATEPSMSAALVDLSAAFEATTSVLDADQLATLEEVYAGGIEILTPEGVEPPSASALLPRSDTGQYLQYWYLAQTPPELRSEVADPGDGSPYSEAHATHDPGLQAITNVLDLDDVVLVDEMGTVVYSTDKRIDFATNLFNGPHRDSGLAEAVRRLDTAAADDVVFVDYAPYVPAGGLPEMWVATVLRTESEIVGVVATAVTNEALVNLTTAGGDWDALGLGDTGEVYIVGSDRLLRSESRLWLEDEAAYIAAMESAGYDAETIGAVETFGTTVLMQPADTQPVEAALRGETFEATTDNYLGKRTRTYAEPITTASLGWIVVTEAQTNEIFAPMRDYVWRLLLVALIAIPLVTLAALTIARRMLQPIRPIVEGANQVAAGDIDVVLDTSGHDEFSDISSQFNAFVAELRHQRAEVVRADQETTELLASVLPRRLVDQYKAGHRDIAESIDNATLVVLTMNGDETGLTDEDRAEYSVQISSGIADIATVHGAENIASNASIGLYATGLGSDELEIDRALEFAAEARTWIQSFLSEREIDRTVGIGVAGGDVVANVIGTDRLAFDVLGSPRRIADDLARVAPPGTILVDAAVAARSTERWSFERMSGLNDVRGAPVEGWRLDEPVARD